MHRTSLLAAAAALTAALALPASASAYEDVAYAVEIQGEGSYERVDVTPHPDGDTHEELEEATFFFSNDISEGVVFRDGHPFDTSGEGLGRGYAIGEATYRGSGGVTTCVGETTSPTRGWMRLMEEPGVLDLDTKLWVRPFDDLVVDLDCPTDQHPAIHLASLDGERDDEGRALPGEHTFDVPFSLPKEVFGMGYVEQLLPLRVTEGERCPGRGDETVSCRLEWEGKVIFRKLWEKQVAPTGTYQPPSTGPGPIAPPAPPKPPVTLDEDDWLVPLVKRGSAKLGATSASVTLTCPSGCAGTASLMPPAGRARAAAARAPRPLVQQRFSARAGRPTRLQLRLGAKTRRALRRSGGRTAQLRLTFSKPARGTRTFSLRVPRR